MAAARPGLAQEKGIEPREYVLVAQQERRIEVYRRDGRRWILDEYGPGERLQLASSDVKVPAFYGGVGVRWVFENSGLFRPYVIATVGAARTELMHQAHARRRSAKA